MSVSGVPAGLPPMLDWSAPVLPLASKGALVHPAGRVPETCAGFMGNSLGRTCGPEGGLSRKSGLLMKPSVISSPARFPIFI